LLFLRIFQDQINLGSRIKSSDTIEKNVTEPNEMRKKVTDEQLWTEDEPTQVDDVISKCF